MNKLTSFLIFIVTLYMVKSENSFKNAVLEWKFHDHFGINHKGWRLIVRGFVPILYVNALKDFKNVSTIILSNTSLKEIQSGAFRNLPKLTSIDCSNNTLREIRNGIFTHLNLKYLFLRNNNISVLEKEAFQYSKIDYLFLEGNKIEKVGRAIFDINPLIMINLYNNSISKLEVGIFDQDLIRLRKFGGQILFLHDNKIEKIDPEVFHTSRINALYMSNNRISHLRPGDLRNMPQLWTLSLSENKLWTIPKGVFTNLHLRYIDLSHNQISTIASNAFDGMNYLNHFDIRHNQLKTYNPNWFHNSIDGNYGEIFFADNFIKEIPSEAFKNYPTIWIIDFRRNKIKNIAFDAFKKTERIQYLLLSENLIEKWNETSFQNRYDLEIFGIDLRKNKLKCFEGDLKDIFAPIDNVWLDGNPFEASSIAKVEKYNQGISPIKEHSLLGCSNKK